MLLCAAGCGQVELQDEPFVQPSASPEPILRIDINRVVGGIYELYRPTCSDTVRVGQTVEFRNFSPDIAANVTAIALPPDAPPLYSPNLVKPYNYVARQDADNKLCESTAADGECIQRPHWSYWRYTFDEPGVYDWVDTNAGEPGRKVVDAYYGTVSYVGTSDAVFATICVLDSSRGGCEDICP